jgi:hypothetical protein
MLKGSLHTLFVLLAGMSLLVAGCHSQAQPAVTATSAQPANSPTQGSLPGIKSHELDRAELPRYESLEIKLTVEAEYKNPYDAREVRLEGVFQALDGSQVRVPGFWDGEQNWMVRFTPWQEGEWSYQLFINDGRGESQPVSGEFRVIESDLHGWLQVGSWIDPAYSSRYLVYHDGTPFYGLGHCDPLNILADGFDIEDGVGLFDNMLAAGENYVVWWPLYSMSPLSKSYADYSVPNLKTIDLVVQDAQEKGIFLVFTIWDHPELRAAGHAWGNGNWARNGFSKLGEIEAFFADPVGQPGDEMWAWQENFYRYIIARWGYSPAIGLWQTVSEINGTNAYAQSDAWHARVNRYFVENDPYRHPTTASMSGDVDWPAGHAAMDIPQVHVYELEDAIEVGQVIAGWTETMFGRGKPNWVGEFGVPGNQPYPEMFHHAIWSALAAGAALTPAEWNDRGGWGQMTPEMTADLGRLGQFVGQIPLAWLDPQALQIRSNERQVRSWGVAGEAGGVFWVQDATLQGKPIEEQRQAAAPRGGVQLEVEGLAEGEYTVTPYDTWQGIYLEPFTVVCRGGPACVIALPEFTRDMAFRIARR